MSNKKEKEEFVEIDTVNVAREQKAELEKEKENLEIISEQYINVKGMLDKTTDEGDKKLLKDNLKELGKQISTMAMSIEEKRKQFNKNTKPVLDDMNWKREQMIIQWNDLNNKLLNKQILEPEEIKAMQKIFKELRATGSTANVLYGGKRKYKRTTRMKRKKLMCPKKCCGVPVRKCGCPKSCKHCNCHEIRRLRKKVRTCKKKRRRRKRTKKKRKRRRKRTRRN